VLLGTVGAGLIDYVFKAQAASIGSGDRLGQFFAIYYAAISVLTFIVQTSLSRRVLERLGLATATGAPSIAIVTGGLAGLLLPPLRSVLVVATRGNKPFFADRLPVRYEVVLHAAGGVGKTRSEGGHRCRLRSAQRLVGAGVIQLTC
jgi:hypothetical protein